MSEHDSWVEQSERSSWTKVKVIGSLLGMNFVYIAVLMVIGAALSLDPMWHSIIIIFSFGLIIAAIYGVRIKVKMPGDTGFEVYDKSGPKAWTTLMIASQKEAVTSSGVSDETIRNRIIENIMRGKGKLVAVADNKTGKLSGVVTKHDVEHNMKGVEVSPENATVVHINRSPLEEARRISKLSPENQKDYLPLVDKAGKPVGVVATVKLTDVLQGYRSAAMPTEIQI